VKKKKNIFPLILIFTTSSSAQLFINSTIINDINFISKQNNKQNKKYSHTSIAEWNKSRDVNIWTNQKVGGFSLFFIFPFAKFPTHSQQRIKHKKYKKYKKARKKSMSGLKKKKSNTHKIKARRRKDYYYYYY